MKIVAVEPIGISQERAKQLAEIYAQKGHQFVVYPDRKEDAPTLIERMQGAEVVIVSNIPLRKEVLQECKDLKFLNVAFTGLDHIDQDYCKENNSVLDYCDEFSLRGKTACELLKHKDVDEYVYKVAHDALTRLMCGD